MTISTSGVFVEKSWHRTESKIVRPFIYSENLLHNAEFRLYDDVDFKSDTAIHYDELNVEKIKPQIRLDFNPISISEELGLPENALRFIVSFEDRALKKTLLAKNIAVTDLDDEIIEFPEALLQELSWSGTTIANIALVLEKDRDSEIGQARRAGNWLAKKSFSVCRTHDTSNFQIEIVPPERFKSYGLPPETTYYVQVIGDDFNQPCDQLPEMVKVYLNETVNPVLARAEDSAAGKALVRGLYGDVSATILVAGFSPFSSLDEIKEGGILQIVTDRISQATGISVSEIFKMSREPGAGRLRAVLQAEAGLTKALSMVSFRG